MIDIQVIRDMNSEDFTQLKKRGISESVIDTLVKADNQRKQSLQEIEAIRSERNKLSKEIGKCTSEDERSKIKSNVINLKESLQIAEKTLTESEDTLTTHLSAIPNIPSKDTPEGDNEDDNVVIFNSDIKKPSLDKPKPHWEILNNLNMINFEQGAKISGSRFYILKSKAAKMQRGLIQFLLDYHADNGYLELNLPYIVREEVVFGSGQLPKFKNNLYKDHEEDYWLIPTAEVPITGMHSNEIIPASKLPLNYSAHTSCFRREKASAGKDVRGIKRGHQFDKVELYSICKPNESNKELTKMKNHIEEICKLLKLPYRIKQLCVGDLGFCSQITYDFEVWAAGCNEWLEVSSVSNCGDFQSRRSKIRFKNLDTNKNELVHTLNGSGLGIPRVMISIIENYQQKDGSIIVPEVLQKYMHTDLIK